MFAESEAVATYEPPDVNVPLNLRVPQSTRELLESVVKAWVILAEARGESKAKIRQTDLSHVCRRLLRVAAEQSLAEVGISADKLLEGDVDWTEVERAIHAAVAKSKR